MGGGSNAIGLFAGFLDDADVRLVGVEPGGRGTAYGEHAAVPPAWASRACCTALIPI